MPSPEIRTSVIAGIRAAWSGSVWANAEDRQLAVKLEALAPGARELTRMGTEFHARACRWALGQGVQGVVFAAAGLPVEPEPHLSYDRMPPLVLPGRFVFADPDEGATAINQAVRARHARVTAVQASARAPGGLLAAAAIPGPVSVQLQFCAHWWTPELAARLVADYGRLMPSGSVLVMSISIPDPRRAEGAVETLGTVAGTVHRHSIRDVTAWITRGGLLVAGRIALKLPPVPEAAWSLCEVVARVPLSPGVIRPRDARSRSTANALSRKVRSSGRCCAARGTLGRVGMQRGLVCRVRG